MDQNEVKNKLNPIFAKIFQQPGIQVHDQMTAADVEKWNSLTHMELIATIETAFAIKFKLKELVAVKNVGDLVGLIAAKA